MTPKLLMEMWAAIAPAAGNHLWQSTVFAMVAGLLTLALRRNRASVRHGVWLAASAKFLIPFSLLVSLGNRVALPQRSAAGNSALFFVMEEMGQPFSPPTAQAISPAASTIWQSLQHLLPWLLAAWLCGFAVVVVVWCTRWRRISQLIGEAAPLRAGREVETLRRLRSIGLAPRLIEILLSGTSLEPGIFGIWRPVLVWPEGISQRLNDAHLEAILAHELFHVQRRDNLAAAMHMVVEAVFWFHPLVWWMGGRLVDERERACDEEVRESGSDPQTYAESILKICEFCVGSPVACVSGVTGADLKKRIGRIMSETVARKLELRKKLLIAAAALLAVAAPLVAGILQSKPDSQTTASKLIFDSASVTRTNSATDDTSMNVDSDRGLLSGKNVRLIAYLYFAYDLTGNQFQLLMPQLPKWVVSDRFDIQARAGGNASKEQMRLMMRSLLADRFHLAVHYESRRLPVFALVLAKAGAIGPQLRPHPAGASCSGASDISGLPNVCGIIEGMPASPSGRLRVGARGVPIGLLASTLAQMGNLDRAVLDQTGLKGNFDFSFEWSPQLGGPGTPGDARVPVASAPREVAADVQQDLREQLGLRLEPQEGTFEVLVVDRIEEPAE